MGRPTLRDIATRAGFSVSTVSYALNDASTMPLSPETKALIRRIAGELGYVPNGLARSLQAQTSRTIGVILGKPLTQQRYAAIVQGITRGLRADGYYPALLDEASALSAIDEVRGRRLDGLVFIGHDDQSVPRGLAGAVAAHDVPFVAVDCGMPDADTAYPTVDFDYAAGVRQVFAHLNERGIRSVVYVRPDIDSPAEDSRAQALAAEVTQRPHLTVHTLRTGMTVDALTHVDVDDRARPSHAVDLAGRLDSVLASVADASAATAVVCAWGADAEVCYRTAIQHDSRLWVAALAHGPLSVEFWPHLVYSRLPLENGGRAAARLIIAASRGVRAEDRVLLEPELITHD